MSEIEVQLVPYKVPRLSFFLVLWLCFRKQQPHSYRKMEKRVHLLRMYCGDNENVFENTEPIEKPVSSRHKAKSYLNVCRAADILYATRICA